MEVVPEPVKGKFYYRGSDYHSDDAIYDNRGIRAGNSVL